MALALALFASMACSTLAAASSGSIRRGVAILPRRCATTPGSRHGADAMKDIALYGEVTPRQKGFKYASEQARFWLFDIRNPAGQWLDADDILYLTLPQNIDMVPLLYHGGYDKAIIDLLVDGSTTVKGASHIREGIVIKTTKDRYRRGVGRAQLKIVSNVFLDMDGKLTKE